MSIVHAYPNTSDHLAPAVARPLTDSIAALPAALAGQAGLLVDGFRRRRTMQRLARFSDHRLADIGFERDWDGTIIPTQR